ncbi:hypothetical protein [Knoellia flava]|nr:hypothetical protein [Knoellia flava]
MTKETRAAANSRLRISLAVVGVGLVAASMFAFADGEVGPGAGILTVGVVFLIAAAAAWSPRGPASLANLNRYQTSSDSGYVPPVGDSGGDSRGGDGGGGGGGGD